MLGGRQGIPSHSNWILLLVVVEHVRQDVLSVLKSLSHLGIVAVKSLIERHG